MKVVIIAGGSGTRLWPLSTPDFPKHLLKLDSQKPSLLQNTYRRALKLSSDILIVSEKSHIEHVRAQLPDVPTSNIIVEPARRGTQNCVIAALAQVGDSNMDDEIVFMPADHYVRDQSSFVQNFKTGADLSRRLQKIVSIGVEPDYPATGFGYIKKAQPIRGTSAYGVAAFKEKPDYQTAREYLNSGQYLWSCSYFIAPARCFVEAMRQYSQAAYNNYRELRRIVETEGYHHETPSVTSVYEETYLKFSSQTFEYGVIEQIDINQLVALPASFDWMDLGSYVDLHKAVDSDESANHVSGNVEHESLYNSFIQNHEDKPLVVVGLDNIIVVNTANGMLVIRKDLAQRVGEVSKKASFSSRLNYSDDGLSETA